MTVGDGRDGWTPKPSLEISHGEFTFLPSPAVPDGAPVVPAPKKSLGKVSASRASPLSRRAGVLRPAARVHEQPPIEEAKERRR